MSALPPLSFPRRRESSVFRTYATGSPPSRGRQEFCCWHTAVERRNEVVHERAARQARIALAAAGVGVAVGDRVVPARHRHRQHGAFRAGLRHAADPEWRAGGAAHAGRRLAAVAAAPQSEGGCVRFAARRTPRVSVRAGGRAAGRAGVRGIGAVHRPQHRKLVRRARRSRARRRAESGPERARLPAQGNGEQGEPDGGDARRKPGQSRERVEPRGGTVQCVRGGAVLADRQRTRGRRRGRLADHSGAAARGRAASGPTAASVVQDRTSAGRRAGVARRGPGEHRRQPQSAQAAAGHRAGAQAARAGCRSRAGRRARLPGAFVFAQRIEAALCIDADVDAAARVDFGARSCRRALGALRLAARAAGRRYARGGARRFHAATAGRLAR